MQTYSIVELNNMKGLAESRVRNLTSQHNRMDDSSHATEKAILRTRIAAAKIEIERINEQIAAQESSRS